MSLLDKIENAEKSVIIAAQEALIDELLIKIDRLEKMNSLHKEHIALLNSHVDLVDQQNIILQSQLAHARQITTRRNEILQ